MALFPKLGRIYNVILNQSRKMKADFENEKTV